MDWKLQVVSGPVSDVDRTIAFTPTRSASISITTTRSPISLRFVQLTPVGSACSIAIGSGITEKPPGSVGGLQLVVTDAAAARALLVVRGVEVGDIQAVQEVQARP